MSPLSGHKKGDLSADRESFSLIIPVCNEDGSLHDLHAQLLAALPRLGGRWEILYVDDGSTDGSRGILSLLKGNGIRVRVILLKKRAGQASALQAGFDHAGGGTIVTFDADLEIAVQDIAPALSVYRAGYDAVFGCRFGRPLRVKHLLSAFGNGVFRLFLRTPVHDMACPLKVLDQRFLRGLVLRHSRHRYLAILLKHRNARFAEVRVRYLPRRHGRSKYRQVRRAFQVLKDLLILCIYPRHFLENHRRDYQIETEK